MSITNIILEVHCLKPSWVYQEKNLYRLYINDELLTERDWIWPTSQFISEDIWVDLIPDVHHTIRLEPYLQEHIFYDKDSLATLTSKSIAEFALKNVLINGNPIDNQNTRQLETSFTL